MLNKSKDKSRATLLSGLNRTVTSDTESRKVAAL